MMETISRIPLLRHAQLTHRDGEEKPNGRGLAPHDIGLIAPLEETESDNGVRIDPEAGPAVLPPHAVAQFFGEGRWLLDEQVGRMEIVEEFRKVLAGLVMDVKAYVIRDSSRDGKFWCGKTGAREMDDE
ncbi:hypothetical protein B0T21DRAFT_408682 [Apiosordaria backusii]|uniref:Uncharacterized protein n=1 Tax=Apiosordaria backusii TaxID=314023 RepID=A0AA40K0Z2_9PEZI|nr:hypothetical protein B0T21DRAFT_408682 [Apiosordaria backusii]